MSNFSNHSISNPIRLRIVWIGATEDRDRNREMNSISGAPALSDHELTEHTGFGSHQVVLYNDNVNTFDHVIDCLIQICNHTIEIARQIALEAHQEGRSIAYVGSHDECLDRKIKLQNEGLTVYVETIS